MGANRLTRVNELLRRETAGALYRVLDPSDVDLAAVTVTRVSTSSDLRNARIFVSVRGPETEQQDALRCLVKHRRNIQEEVASHIVLKYMPHFHFHLDHSVEEGDRVLEILTELNLPVADNGEELDEP